MSGRHAAIIAAILVAALLAVGLILLRPMAPENYAAGVFSFEAVTEIQVSAGTYALDSAAAVLSVGPEDEAFEELIGFFDGKGFGRTFGSLFSSEPPVARVGDPCFRVTFLCGGNGASLTAVCQGADLRLTGDTTVAVTAQNKESWCARVHDAILALYPEPVPEPEPEPGETTEPSAA